MYDADNNVDGIWLSAKKGKVYSRLGNWGEEEEGKEVTSNRPR